MNELENSPRLAPHAPATPTLSRTLRTALWNVVLARLFGKLVVNGEGRVQQEYHVFLNAWRNFFVLPMDEFEKYLASRREWYRDQFEIMEPRRVYEFFEFVAARMVPFDASEWMNDTNAALENDGSPLRLVGGRFVVMGPGLASAEALRAAFDEFAVREWKPPADHLKNALAVLSVVSGRAERDDADREKGGVDFSAAITAARAAVRAAHEQVPNAESVSLPAFARAVLDTPDGEFASDPAAATFFVSHAATFITFFLSRAVAEGLLPAIDKKSLAPPVSDPWGERRLGAVAPSS